MLFFGPYLRRPVGKIVGKNSLWRQCWSGEKKRQIQNRVFRVELAQKWFVRPQTWKEQGICLQKLQAVVITFLLFSRRIHRIVKLTLTTFTKFLELYWKCACVSRRGLSLKKRTGNGESLKWGIFESGNL